MHTSSRNVFPRQIIGSTPWLGRLWDKIDVLAEKPVLIVWGMKDIAFREKELLQWQRTFPQAQTVRLPTVGHYVQEEAPDALGNAVDAFLAK
ncbi:MAG: alpha/beta fold hydrolase [Caldilineaceae bacterium]|nr:alpha/beta fold hydrolase [Caldilineaceae bacterium]